MLVSEESGESKDMEKQTKERDASEAKNSQERLEKAM